MEAEILRYQDNRKIDWDEVNLLKCKTDSFIVLTNGVHDSDHFSGVVLSSSAKWSIGYQSGLWDKSYFEKVTEQLTIKFIP